MGIPASIRNNNPGAMWPGATSANYGSTGSQPIAGNNLIATFPDPTSGAAAQFSLLNSPAYSGLTLSAAINKWSGGNSSAGYISKIADELGISASTKLTPELLSNSSFAIPLARTMAQVEAGQTYPITDQQWADAFAKGTPGASPPASGNLANTQPTGDANQQFNQPYAPTSDPVNLGDPVQSPPLSGPSPEYNPAPNENVTATPVNTMSQYNTQSDAQPGAPIQLTDYLNSGGTLAGVSNPYYFNQNQWDTGMYGYNANGNWTNFGTDNTSASQNFGGTNIQDLGGNTSLGSNLSGAQYAALQTTPGDTNPVPNENVTATPVDTMTLPDSVTGAANAGAGITPTSGNASGTPSDFNQQQWDTGMWGYNGSGDWTNFSAPKSGNTSTPNAAGNLASAGIPTSPSNSGALDIGSSGFGNNGYAGAQNAAGGLTFAGAANAGLSPGPNVDFGTAHFDGGSLYNAMISGKGAAAL
jgi:hypothetical protein